MPLTHVEKRNLAIRLACLGVEEQEIADACKHTRVWFYYQLTRHHGKREIAEDLLLIPRGGLATFSAEEIAALPVPPPDYVVRVFPLAGRPGVEYPHLLSAAFDGWAQENGCP